jgi:hypothetical protein
VGPDSNQNWRKIWGARQTEGNPRNGSFDAGSSTGQYFFARPEFARTVRLEMAFEF